MAVPTARVARMLAPLAFSTGLQLVPLILGFGERRFTTVSNVMDHRKTINLGRAGDLHIPRRQ